MTAGLSLAALAVASGTAAVVVDHKKIWKLIYLFRPLTMLLIIAVACLGQANGPAFRLRIVAGLVLSLAGDVFMMLKEKRFTEGLAAFLLAHLFYVSAFLTVMRPRADFGTLLPLFIFASGMLTVLFPHLEKLKIPVAFYILVITVMSGLAIQRYVDVGGGPAFRAFLGALLFLASDSVLAVNRFVRPVPGAQKIILGTYFAAQLLFASAV